VIRKAQTAADWQALIAEDKPSAAGVALWILGLRPFRQNLCLWESEG
jgi:hypothetical protein